MPSKVVNYKKKAIALAKEIARGRKVCERCGRLVGQFQGAHIMPEPFEQTAADLENILCLCPHCHRLGKLSWHQSPVHGVRWLEQAFPGRIERLLKKVEHEEKINWPETYHSLTTMRG